ncbi:MAG: hypothetical protein IPM69_03845 [Ignavibacteria bacterium]|nr:hypothetical protein [Ignavibacteria bacterium]
MIHIWNGYRQRMCRDAMHRVSTGMPRFISGMDTNNICVETRFIASLRAGDTNFPSGQFLICPPILTYTTYYSTVLPITDLFLK